MQFRNGVFMFLFSALALLIHQPLAQAQTDLQKFEAGGHYTSLRNEELNKSDDGVGGRLTLNLNRALALEGELNFFPDNVQGLSQHRLQGLFGVKAGWRGERFGVFGKARPGFLNYGKATAAFACPAVVPSPIICQLADGKTQLAFDVGGVIEAYTSKRTLIRFDVGDTMIRYQGPALRASGQRANGDFTSHNLQFHVGFGVRF